MRGWVRINRGLFDKPINPASVTAQSVQPIGPGSPAYRLEPRGFELLIWPDALQAQAAYQVTLFQREIGCVRGATFAVKLETPFAIPQAVQNVPSLAREKDDPNDCIKVLGCGSFETTAYIQETRV